MTAIHASTLPAGTTFLAAGVAHVPWPNQDHVCPCCRRGQGANRVHPLEQAGAEFDLAWYYRLSAVLYRGGHVPPSNPWREPSRPPAASRATLVPVAAPPAKAA